jgi:hypothetical protein
VNLNLPAAARKVVKNRSKFALISVKVLYTQGPVPDHAFAIVATFVRAPADLPF